MKILRLELSIRQISANPYWSRVRVIKEILLVKRIKVVVSHRSISWEQLVQIERVSESSFGTSEPMNAIIQGRRNSRKVVPKPGGSILVLLETFCYSKKHRS